MSALAPHSEDQRDYHEAPGGAARSSAAPQQRRDEETVAAVALGKRSEEPPVRERRAPLRGRRLLETGIFGEECFDHVGPLLGLERANGVHERAPGDDER